MFKLRLKHLKWNTFYNLKVEKPLKIIYSYNLQNTSRGLECASPNIPFFPSNMLAGLLVAKNIDISNWLASSTLFSISTPQLWRHYLKSLWSKLRSPYKCMILFKNLVNFASDLRRSLGKSFVIHQTVICLAKVSREYP